MQLQSVPTLSQKSRILRNLPIGLRKITLGVLASTQLLFAQDQHAGDGSLSEDLNFLHSSDPSAESLNHSFSDNQHVHFGSEMTYSRNHATQDGTLEQGNLAGLGLHAQIPLSHGINGSTLAKISAHGLASTNSTDPLRHELMLDFGFIRNQGLWKIAGGLTILHEVSQLPHTHTEAIFHDDGHGHVTSESHTETTIGEHIYTGVGAYLDIARQVNKNVFAVLHLEHDESRTGSGSFGSLGIQAYKIPLTHRLHFDTSCMAIIGDGERFQERGVCVMPSVALHFMLTQKSSIFTSATGIIPVGQKSGDLGTAFTIGLSFKN